MRDKFHSLSKRPTSNMRPNPNLLIKTLDWVALLVFRGQNEAGWWLRYYHDKPVIVASMDP